MNQSLSFLALYLCFSFSITAQDWSPIQPSEKYYYQLDGENYISHSIFVDSVIYGEFYTTYHFNRVIVECDTCISSYDMIIDAYSETGRRINQGSIYGDFVNITENGWEFEGDHSFVIKPNQELYAEWDFNEEGLTASIFGLSEQEILGELDSIKSIGLSSGEIILLSKNHGLVEFPKLESTEVFDLIGLEELSLGAYIPDFEDIFSYEVGDIYQYEKISWDYGNSEFNETSNHIGCKTSIKLKVLDKNLNEDGISATFLNTVRDSCYNSSIDVNVVEWYQDTINFYYSKSDYMNLKHQPNQINLSNEHVIPVRPNHFLDEIEHIESGFNHNTRYDKMEDGTIIEYYGGYEYFGEEKDPGIVVFPENTNIYEEIPFITGDYDFAFEGGSFHLTEIMGYSGFAYSYEYNSFSFGEDLGITSFLYQDISYDGETSPNGFQCEIHLDAYSTASISKGEIIPDEILLSIGEKEISDFKFLVYPNPATHFVQIQIPKSKNIDKVEMYNSFGQIVLVETNKLNNIDISKLESGVYYMKISESNKEFISRIIKL